MQWAAASIPPADEAELKGYLDSGLVKGILSDVVVNLEAPEEPETEETTKAAEDEVIVDGVAHLKYADVVLPEGWSVDRVKNFEIKLTRDEKVPGNAPGDLLTPTLTISTTSSNKSAKEWAETKFKDFGSKGEIKNENIGGIDWVYFMPVEDQFYMFTDSSAGTHVDVSGMFFTIDEEIEGSPADIVVFHDFLDNVGLHEGLDIHEGIKGLIHGFVWAIDDVVVLI